MLEPLLCGLISQAPLIPKLRGHFAEFLNNASPVGLRILSSSTCVGLRYGLCIRYSGFSWQSYLVLRYFISLPLAGPGSPFPALTSVLRPHSSDIIRCRNINLLSIDYALRLALGPDFPRADQLYPGILGYSAWRILTSISLLIPAFSLHSAPLLLSVQFLRPCECSPTDHLYP